MHTEADMQVLIVLVGLVGLLLMLVGSALIIRSAERQVARHPADFEEGEGGQPPLDISKVVKELASLIKEIGKYLGPDPEARAGGILIAFGLVLTLAALTTLAAVSLTAHPK